MHFAYIICVYSNFFYNTKNYIYIYIIYIIYKLKILQGQINQTTEKIQVKENYLYIKNKILMSTYIHINIKNLYHKKQYMLRIWIAYLSKKIFKTEIIIRKDDEYLS